MLTGSKLAFFIDGRFVCSGLVARALERTGRIFDRDPSHIAPADLAKYLRGRHGSRGGAGGGVAAQHGPDELGPGPDARASGRRSTGGTRSSSGTGTAGRPPRRSWRPPATTRATCSSCGVSAGGFATEAAGAPAACGRGAGAQVGRSCASRGCWPALRVPAARSSASARRDPGRRAEPGEHPPRVRERLPRLGGVPVAPQVLAEAQPGTRLLERLPGPLVVAQRVGERCLRALVVAEQQRGAAGGDGLRGGSVRGGGLPLEHRHGTPGPLGRAGPNVRLDQVTCPVEQHGAAEPVGERELGRDREVADRGVRLPGSQLQQPHRSLRTGLHDPHAGGGAEPARERGVLAAGGVGSRDRPRAGPASPAPRVPRSPSRSRARARRAAWAWVSPGPSRRRASRPRRAT